MSGIIPPSVMTMQYAVDTGFKKYVNLSFPYRIKIESIWFTADDALSGRGSGGSEGNNSWDLERMLRLGAVKARNGKRPHDSGDVPTDINLVWGGELYVGQDGDITEDAKPSMWFGDPDHRPNTGGGNGDEPSDEQVQYQANIWDTEITWRSTSRALPSLEDSYPWANPVWDEPTYEANKYKTDLSIMNPDEILSLFVYSSDGDWSDYDDNSGIVTIFVQYTGVGGDVVGNPTHIWE